MPTDAPQISVQWTEKKVPVASLIPYERNPRHISPEAQERLKTSILEMGYHQRIIAQPDLRVIGGHQRIKALKDLGIEEITVLVPNRELTPEEFRRLLVQDNLPFGSFDFEMLSQDFKIDELKGWGMPDDWMKGMQKVQPSTLGNLAERFGIAPFSVFNAREGWWQDRKSAWLALGMQSELGRGDNLLRSSDTVKMPARANAKTFGTDGNISEATGTSIFDPVLCEIAYRWFCPPMGQVLDPFAGGSVRGLVAGRLGRLYTGIDLSASQVEANDAQGAAICPQNPPRYITSDSTEMDNVLPEDFQADFVFSCPPYFDLEIYSDNPKDLSHMDYGEFLTAYRTIIAKACARLRNDRFACFVVGEVRDKHGAYRNFVGDTIQAFLDAGLQYYNEAILITMVGSLPLRVGKQFTGSRKLGKTHQNVLVFVKGSGNKAAEAIGEIEFAEQQPDLQAASESTSPQG